ncbi:hypothetical protein OEZ86_001416 [Tetradesmus obliquus]|nr:hypothetical protein OEZ86_001416 [Tetradesmus obliquus]
MIISSQQWHVLWEAITDDFPGSTEKGLSVIFSLQEVETVCAVKMLLAGLKMQDVHYTAYPVDNVSELRSTLHALLEGSQEFRTVVLVNCGAGHFARDLQPASAQNVRYVVVDSHRPVCPKYNNADDIECVLLLDDDDPLSLQQIPPACDLDGITEEERQSIIDGAEREDQEEEEQSQDGQPVSREWRDKLRALRARQRLLSDYFDMGSSYGKPSPLLLQPLAEELAGRADLSVLWPCCVGLTDQWVHQRVSSEHYRLWYAKLCNDVGNYFGDNKGAQGQQQQRDNNSTGQRAPSTARVAAEREYRIMLHRHWSLFDAFAYSSYVAPRMQTWRQAGRESLQLLFAHMGIKEAQAKLPYTSLQQHDLQAFHGKLQEALEKSRSRLAFSDLACDGFALHHSRQVTAASDVVHAVTALLTEHTVAEVAGDRQSSAAFWHAVEAIDAHSTEGWKQLQHGIKMAKCMQQAIIQDGGLMVTDRMLITNAAAKMQELFLHTSPPTNAREFRHPLTLLRLAQFVRDATKVARLRPCSYPILVVGPEDSQGCCLVLGLRANLLASEAQYNIFGRTFRSVLEHPDCNIMWDDSREAFDSAVVYVNKASIQGFCSDIRSALCEAARAAEEARQQEQQQKQQQQQEQQQQGRRRPRDQAAGDGAAAAGPAEGSRDSQRQRTSEGAAAAAAAAASEELLGSDAEPAEVAGDEEMIPASDAEEDEQ